MRDILEGRFLSVAFLKECIAQINSQGKYKPEVLILSHDDFRGHFNAIAFHGYDHHIINSYRKLGIKRLVWAEDVADGEILLSSGKGIAPDVETIVFKELS